MNVSQRPVLIAARATTTRCVLRYTVVLLYRSRLIPLKDTIDEALQLHAGKGDHARGTYQGIANFTRRGVRIGVRFCISVKDRRSNYILIARDTERTGRRLRVEMRNLALRFLRVSRRPHTKCVPVGVFG